MNLRSVIRVAPFLMVWLVVSGCVVSETRPLPKLEATQAREQIPDAELLDVAIGNFAANIPAEFADDVEAQLARRVVELISLCRKAGKAVVGYEKVKDWLTKDQAQILIQASDGSERGKTKLHAPGGRETFIGCLTARELGLAFGREHAIHGALASGGLTTRVVEEASRLAGLRKQLGGTAASKDTKNA